MIDRSNTGPIFANEREARSLDSFLRFATDVISLRNDDGCTCYVAIIQYILRPTSIKVRLSHEMGAVVKLSLNSLDLPKCSGKEIDS